MTGRWAKARLDEIPAEHPPEWWDPWARDAGRYGERWRAIRLHFGIESFGVNAYEADAGEELIVAHDEAAYGGQEELYFVVRGRARFRLDGTEVEVGEGELLHVAPEVVRQADALEPTLIFMVGGTAGRAFEVYDYAEGT